MKLTITSAVALLLPMVSAAALDSRSTCKDLTAMWDGCEKLDVKALGLDNPRVKECTAALKYIDDALAARNADNIRAGKPSLSKAGLENCSTVVLTDCSFTPKDNLDFVIKYVFTTHVSE